MGDRKGKSCALSFKDSWEGSPERCRHIQKHVLSLTHHCVTCHEHCSSRVPQSTGQLRVRVCVCKKREVILINLSLIYQASETFPFIYIRIYPAHARAHRSVHRRPLFIVHVPVLVFTPRSRHRKAAKPPRPPRQLNQHK